MTYLLKIQNEKQNIHISIWNESLVLPITGTWRYKYVTLFLTIKQYTLYLIKQKVHIAASLSILTSLFSKKLQNACTRMTAYICGISTLTCEVMPASYNWISNYCEVHQKATFIFDKVARNSKNALADQSQR